MKRPSGRFMLHLRYNDLMPCYVKAHKIVTHDA